MPEKSRMEIVPLADLVTAVSVGAIFQFSKDVLGYEHPSRGFFEASKAIREMVSRLRGVVGMPRQSCKLDGARVVVVDGIVTYAGIVKGTTPAGMGFNREGDQNS